MRPEREDERCCHCTARVFVSATASASPHEVDSACVCAGCSMDGLIRVREGVGEES